MRDSVLSSLIFSLFMIILVLMSEMQEGFWLIDSESEFTSKEQESCVSSAYMW